MLPALLCDLRAAAGAARHGRCCQAAAPALRQLRLCRCSSSCAAPLPANRCIHARLGLVQCPNLYMLACIREDPSSLSSFLSCILWYMQEQAARALRPTCGCQGAASYHLESSGRFSSREVAGHQKPQHAPQPRAAPHPQLQQPHPQLQQPVQLAGEPDLHASAKANARSRCWISAAVAEVTAAELDPLGAKCTCTLPSCLGTVANTKAAC